MIPVQRPSIGEEELTAVGEVFKTGWLGMGSVTKKFEDAVGDFIGAKHVAAVNTGTTALHLAFDVANLGPGDEIIVPSLTYVATVQVITTVGAKPIFCDIDEKTLNLDVEEVKKRITGKTKAIVPVHYRGMPCNMDQLLDLAEQYNLRVIEDAAHAFGSHFKGTKIGSFGDITCFSFDPIKNITCGEGGAIITQDKKTLDLIQRKRILGIDKDTWSRYRNERSWFYDVTTKGYRYHMSNINAAIGLVQLKKFEKMNNRKIVIAKKYDKAFSHLGKIELFRTDYDGLGLFMYIIKILDNREDLITFLKERGIGTGIHYIPIHKFSLYNKKGLDLPVTEKIFNQILTLPLFPDITNEQADHVITAIQEWDEDNIINKS